MNHLPLNVETVQKQDSVAIFCDFQNVSSIKKSADLLLDFAKMQGNVNWKNFYYSSHHKNQVDAKNTFELLGFNCVDVPDASKNSADNQLMTECGKVMKFDPAIRTIILVLGDWDFAGLICVLQGMGKKVIVFGQRKSTSQKLIKLVRDDNFHFIDDLHQLVGEKTQPRTTVINSQINYNEAVECLIATVNDALRQNRPTHYSYIGKLMRKLFPKYQGVASISIPNGKKIKSFGKFVDMVVKEGKIIRQNQELFLRELDKIPA